MLPRLWGNGKMNGVDDASLAYFRSLGVSHIWYTGILKHSTGKPFVKGDPGSPYAVSDYYDINPYLAETESERMLEFEQLVKRTHEAGLKVIIDFVPNHVGRDYGMERVRDDVSYFGDSDDRTVHWKESNDFFYYPGEKLTLPTGSTYDELPARASGNAYTPEPDINDWYDTIKLNYCPVHTATWDKMLDILLFWASKGVDGFRCDMVELVPDGLFRWAITEVKKQYPDILFIAEVYQKEKYRQYIRQANFDYLYDKSGLYDVLRAVVMKNTIGSATAPGLWQSTKNITWNWQSLCDLQPRMLNFLENHDEQRFASSYFGADGRNCFAALGVSLLFNTAPFLIYFGQEYGERGMESEGFSGPDGRTSIFDYCTVPSLVRGLNGTLTVDETVVYKEYCRLMRIATADALFSEGATYDLMYANPSSGRFDPSKQFAWMRSHSGAAMVVVANFSDSPVSVDVFIPRAAFEFAGIDSGDRTIKVKIGPNDYARTDVSR